MSTMDILFIYATLLYLPILLQLYDINIYFDRFLGCAWLFLCITHKYLYGIYIYYNIVTISNSLFVCFT